MGNNPACGCRTKEGENEQQVLVSGRSRAILTSLGHGNFGKTKAVQNSEKQWRPKNLQVSSFLYSVALTE
jgi:hypothetical protein